MVDSNNSVKEKNSTLRDGLGIYTISVFLLTIFRSVSLLLSYSSSLLDSVHFFTLLSFLTKNRFYRLPIPNSPSLNIATKRMMGEGSFVLSFVCLCLRGVDFIPICYSLL